VVAARLSIALVGLLCAAPAAQADVSFEPVQLGTTPDVQEIVLTNDGDDTFETGVPSITGADADAFKFVHDYCLNDTLDPGEDCEMSVEFDPLRTGPNGATLEVPIAGEAEPFRLALSGDGRPSLSVTPSAYDFGSFPWGTPIKALTVDVTVQNVTAEELTGLRASSTTTTPLSLAFGVTARTCGATLAPGATCVYTVSFRTYALGTYTGELRVLGESRTLARVPLAAARTRPQPRPTVPRTPQPRTPSALTALSKRLGAAIKLWKHADRAHLRRGFVVSGFVAPADGKLELTVLGHHAVARGSLVVHAGKPARLLVRPTSAGRRLLRLDRKLKLRAVLKFTASADARVSRASAALALRAND
jgi:hypothetical protein